eukprot:scaffold29782_cov53-Cyclotella_meneghiniana.AAC.2
MLVTGQVLAALAWLGMLLGNYLCLLGNTFCSPDISGTVAQPFGFKWLDKACRPNDDVIGNPNQALGAKVTENVKGDGARFCNFFQEELSTKGIMTDRFMRFACQLA